MCCSNEEWSLILTAISTCIVLIGVPIAIYNLRVITKTHHLQSLSKFMDDLSSTEEERLYLYREFCQINDYSNLAKEPEAKVQKIVNSLNRIGMLIENKVLSPESVLSISHTVIIRCYYLLEPYINYQEEKIGARYGRRLRRLDYRAKLFHDIRPHQRINSIKLHHSNGSHLIYKTEIRSGVKGIIQRLIWGVRFSLHMY